MSTNEKNRAYYAANAERLREYRRAYRIAHREEVNAKLREYHAKNKDKAKARAKVRYEANREDACAKQRAYYLANREAVKASTADYRKRNAYRHRALARRWAKENPTRHNANNAQREAAEIRAVPRWANRFFIEEAYDLARRRTQCTGVKWHVDHVVPLRSKLVSGLHVESNLNVITARSNASKGNRHWPDMP